jgi:hypothetical protein
MGNAKGNAIQSTSHLPVFTALFGIKFQTHEFIIDANEIKIAVIDLLF